ncbi:YeeE/YedE family protein [Aggregatibacter actinomycetemcomitans]|uniref:YeeE/YedE family protein n=1 Tax=Aggregatibacter actinomycetemcomitans TaxID=714 RepID=UPI00197B4A0F|nr:YeeE/YedE family protein [Aggregatibacter actinomycetemcomitans]MBN6070431.1 YeeE/YedE family protein [Aggregatibacter actinomycetemcomitans]
MILTGLLCGFLLGFIMQRGRFCITGAFRDMYVTKSSKMFVAFLIVITVQAIGVFALKDAGVLAPKVKNFAFIATVIGAFIFGVGIVLAGGCSAGSLYRVGEGLFGSWVALATYALFSAIMRAGPLSGFNKELRGITVEQTTIYDTLGVSPWALVVLLSAVTLFLVFRAKKNKPKTKIATLKPKKSGLAHILFEKRWDPFVTAILMGLVAILAWVTSVASGRNGGLGITGPAVNFLQFMVSGDGKFVNWGTMLLIGVPLGGFITAKFSNEFRFRVPDSRTILFSAFGGVCMGIGASLAGGCSIGNGLVETALFSWQGWVALPLMVFGTWVAAYFTLIRPQSA